MFSIPNPATKAARGALGLIRRVRKAIGGADSISVLDQTRTADGPKSTYEIRLAMQKVMQTDVSVRNHLMKVFEELRRWINHSRMRYEGPRYDLELRSS